MYNEQILIKLSEGDKAFLKSEADKQRLPLSAYVRHRIFNPEQYKNEKNDT
jgi:hypothetical protein